MWQAIIWTNDGPVHWYIGVPLGLELNSNFLTYPKYKFPIG